MPTATGQLDADELARKNADEARGAQAPTQSAGSQESVIELSPFQVDASGDIGYYAENTLAAAASTPTLATSRRRSPW